MRNRNKRIAGFLLVGTGSIFTLWGLAALLAGLQQTGWNVTEFVRQGMVAAGLIKPINSMVTFYSHIKGVEYLICVAFFVVFIGFYRFVDKPERLAQTVTERSDSE